MFWLPDVEEIRSLKVAIGSKLIFKYRLNFFTDLDIHLNIKEGKLTKFSIAENNLLNRMVQKDNAHRNHLTKKQEHKVIAEKTKVREMQISNDDNIYPVGMLITANEDPSRQLIIHKYYHRIYYCAVADDPGHRHFAYFERELIPPSDGIPKKPHKS